MKITDGKITAAVLLLLVALTCAAAGSIFGAMYEKDVIIAGPGVDEVKMLSEWFPGIVGTPGDTEVYVLRGEAEGPSMLLLGGTHPNEVAAYMAAVLFVEKAEVDAGTLYVIPRTNNSGFTCNNPGDAQPREVDFVNQSGQTRKFTYGSRATNPLHQYPDPEVYVNYAGQSLSGSETRNLNRCYPGKADGTLTEKVCYAIVSLIRAESVDMSVDLHEASPEYAVVNAMVSHERAMMVAATAAMSMQFRGINISLEPSPVNLRGLSHRELGDYTDTLSMLMESTNPSQGRLRGATNADLALEGKDRFYLAAEKLGMLHVPYDAEGWPVEVRVARHATGVLSILDAYGQIYGRRLAVRNIPGYEELCDNGVGHYLN